MALGHEPSPVRTQDGDNVFSPSISYFPDGQQIMSGFCDNIVRLWDLRTGKEVEEVRCKQVDCRPQPLHQKVVILKA